MTTGDLELLPGDELRAGVDRDGRCSMSRFDTVWASRRRPGVPIGQSVA